MITPAVKERLDGLKNLRDIHSQDGNWNHDHYMTGLYNGLEIAIATLEGRNPDIKKVKV